MNPLRIEQMTIFDVAPAEVVSIAAALDVPAVSLWTNAGGMPGANPVTEASKGSVLERLRDSPVRVEAVEAFTLEPDMRETEPAVALAAELGARAVVAIDLIAEEEGLAAEQLARFCELARRHGLLVYLEPIWLGKTRTPAEGMGVVQASGADNARIVIDALHVVRSGSTPADVAAIPPEWLGSAQICDGPATIDPESGFAEAISERGVPGTGEFPLRELLGAWPSTLSLGIEVPLRAARERGEPALERTRRVVEATRRLQRACERAPAR